MLKTDYNIPIFEDTDSADLNKYSTEMADALKTQLNNTSEELKDIDQKIENAVNEFSKPLIYKGSVSTYQDLPSMATSGDIYTVITENKNYIWNGTTWVEYASTLDLSGLINALTNNKSTVTGTNITINDSAEARVEEIHIRGNSVQDGTPTPENPVEINSCGDNVNLFDKDNANIVNGYISPSQQRLDFIQNNVDKTLYISCLPSTKYTIQKISSSRFYVCSSTSVENGTSVTNATNCSSLDKFTLETGANDRYICITYYTPTDTLTEQEILDSIKIEKCLEATPYSPYNQGCINETICNKNLLDLTKKPYSESASTLNGAIVSINNGVLTVDATNSTGTTHIKSEWKAYTDNSTILIPKGTYYTSLLLNLTGVVSLVSKQVGGGIFTLEEDCYLTQWFFTVSQGNKMTKALQIEEGQTATEYVEHKSQTYTIPTQKPFRAIGDYKDTFVKQDGIWYEKHYIGEVMFNGTENWRYPTAGTDYTFYQLTASVFTALGVPMFKTGYNVDVVKSSHFINILGDDAVMKINQGIAIQKDIFRISLSNSKATTVEEFKTWLASNNVTADYVLETPELIPCTTEQIIKLNEIQALAKTYKNTTHIFSEDEVSPEIEVTYYKDLEIMLNNA